MYFAKRTAATMTAAVCLMGVPAVMPTFSDAVMMTVRAEDDVLMYGDLTYEVSAFYGDVAIITGCNNQSVEVVEIPAEIDGKVVARIGCGAFEDCTSLTSVTIPESVTDIEDGAFLNCSSLTSIIIPESVSSIGGYAFFNCDSLTSIMIPKNVCRLGEYVFSSCDSLTSIETADGNACYASEDGVLFNKEKTELVCFPKGKEGTYAIPKGVTGLYGDAFEGCMGLTSISIPESLSMIYGGAFASCTSLTSIEVADGNENYVSEGSALLTKDKTTLICCFGGTEGSYTIPDSVTFIGSYAFAGCTKLTDIIIPNSITNTGWYVFSGCTGLTSLTFPEGMTHIGEAAFMSCTNLKSITIPKSMTSIGIHVFSVYNGLTDIYYAGTEEEWNAISIRLDTGLGDSLDNITIHYNSTAPEEPTFVLGEVNGDSSINASDAAIVLITAAQIGAGNAPDLTEAQRKAADVNKDEKINASDAAIILMYAAAVGAGDKNVSIEDFVAS